MTVLFHPSHPAWSKHLLGGMWLMCAFGCAIELWYHSARGALSWIKYVSLVLYFCMGWAAALPPVFRDLRAAMQPKALRLLVGGGLAYTLGIPAFVRNKNLDHVIWHLFVLAGSVLHYLSLRHVIDASLAGSI